MCTIYFVYIRVYIYVCVYVYKRTQIPDKSMSLHSYQQSSLPSKQQHILLSDTHQDVPGLSITSFIFRAVFLRRHELLFDFLLQIFLFFGQHFLGFPKSLDCVLGCRLLSALFPTAEQLHPHRHFGINADNYLKKSPGIFGSKKISVKLLFSVLKQKDRR